MEHEFLTRIQKKFEKQLYEYVLYDQMEVLAFLFELFPTMLSLSNQENSYRENEGKHIAGYSPCRIGGKILPINKYDVIHLKNFFKEKDLRSEFQRFSTIIKKFYYSQQIKFILKEEFDEDPSALDIIQFLSIYIVDKPDWSNFCSFISDSIDQIWYKVSDQFSNQFYGSYKKWLGQFFKEYTPQEPINFLTTKIIRTSKNENFRVIRTLQNYQKFMRLKNDLIPKNRSYVYHWKNFSDQKLKLKKFDTVIALGGIDKMSLLIYYNGKVYQYGFDDKWGFSKNYTEFTKKSSIEDLILCTWPCYELIALSNK